MEESSDSALVIKAKPVRKIFKAPVRVNKIPQQLLNDPLINAAIGALPSNYNFEIHKTIWRIRENKSKRVGLQMPEGLLIFASTIADIIEEFTDAETIILGDVTYGACCIDDFTARALNIDFLVHYGHSCLIPIDQTTDIKLLYIFVDIKIDVMHCIETLELNLPIENEVALFSTIQFVGCLQAIAAEMKKHNYKITIPQIKPLSPGEILGCTAPKINSANVIVYVGDGRFHLEAVMIANPGIRTLKYDPYEKKLTEEFYDHKRMRGNREKAIKQSIEARKFGLILGSLGRQGSTNVLNNLERRLKELNKEYIVILLSEIFPCKLALFDDVDAFIQIACPRLSIDWGTTFDKPLLNPYEAAVVLNLTKFDSEKCYPMDYYANESLGSWTPNHKTTKFEEEKKICCGKCKDVG